LAIGGWQLANPATGIWQILSVEVSAVRIDRAERFSIAIFPG